MYREPADTSAIGRPQKQASSAARGAAATSYGKPAEKHHQAGVTRPSSPARDNRVASAPFGGHPAQSKPPVRATLTKAGPKRGQDEKPGQLLSKPRSSHHSIPYLLPPEHATSKAPRPWSPVISPNPEESVKIFYDEAPSANLASDFWQGTVPGRSNPSGLAKPNLGMSDVYRTPRSDDVEPQVGVTNSSKGVDGRNAGLPGRSLPIGVQPSPAKSSSAADHGEY
jgi:hypothetical protein